MLRDFDMMTPVSGKQDMIVSYLPLSHISAQMLDIWIAIKAGMLTFFAQPDALRVRPGEGPARRPEAFGGVESPVHRAGPEPEGCLRHPRLLLIPQR